MTADNGQSTAEDRTARAILAEHRDSIDRLDAILIYTLSERFKHTKAVGKLKAAHDLPASDPAREASQTERLQCLAKNTGMDPEFAKKIINFIFKEVICHHNLQRKKTPNAGAESHS